MDYSVYCDGAISVNPGGVAVYAFAVEASGRVIQSDAGEIGSGDGMSCNVAEYFAVLNALLWLKRQGGKAKIYTDSQLVEKQVNEKWRIKTEHLRPLVTQVRDLLKSTNSTLAWIPRTQNRRADALASQALGEATINIERTREGYE